MRRKRKKQATPETALKRAAVKLMKSYAIESYHNMQGLGCFPGLADRTAFHDGRVIFLEFKRPGGHQSAKQRDFEAMCQRNKIDYYIVESISDIERIFNLPVLFDPRKVPREPIEAPPPEPKLPSKADMSGKRGRLNVRF